MFFKQRLNIDMLFTEYGDLQECGEQQEQQQQQVPGRPSAATAAPGHSSDRQPLQLRPDHGNASNPFFMPDHPLHRQASGDKQAPLASHNAAAANKPS